MEEIWKNVEGFEGLYQISNLGRVKSLGNSKTRKEKILKCSLEVKGYIWVRLHKSGKGHVMKTHRLVAMHFIPNPENKPQVNHINGIKNDNHVGNLEWVSNQENQNHAWATGLRTGLKIAGEKNSLSKLKNADIPIIRQMIAEGVKQKVIAEKYNVHRDTISLIKTGKIWKSVA